RPAGGRRRGDWRRPGAGRAPAPGADGARGGERALQAAPGGALLRGPHALLRRALPAAPGAGGLTGPHEGPLHGAIEGPLRADPVGTTWYQRGLNTHLSP